MQRKTYLESLVRLVPGLQKAIINLYLYNEFDDPTAEYAHACPYGQVEMRDVDCRRFRAVMHDILRSGRDPPAAMLEAIRARLEAAGLERTDPLEFLQWVDRKWEVYMHKIDRLMRAHNHEVAVRAFREISDVHADFWSEAS